MMSYYPFPVSCYLRQPPPSPDDSHDIPDMFSSSSLQSFPESENDSLSSSGRSSTRALSPASSRRSIFESYWSSPQHIKNLETDGDDDDNGAIVGRLQMLQLPLTMDDEDSVATAGRIILAPSIQHKESFDDDSVAYRAAPTPKRSSPTRTPRRQILPKPPPPAAGPSSPIRHEGRLDLWPNKPLDAGRKSRSASALLERRPLRSCLRRSRYSSSAVAGDATTDAGRTCRGLCDGGFDDPRSPAASSHDPRVGLLRKSVSFQSRASVLHFVAPREEEQRGQAGWSKMFA